MALRVYNTLSGQKEQFKPLEDKKVKIYSCGPTVYDYFHIGNARAFLVPDIIKRYLEYKGYDIFHALNFTDIDDKMIKRANEEGITIKKLADRFIAAFKEDIKALNIKQADINPKATEHIRDMIEMIEELINKGYAYESKGDVYFRVEEFEEYGKLSNKKLEDLIAGARVEQSSKKENPADFTLWKKSKEGEPSWESPWGDGRPGWHIECSVMANKYLGDSFDIHTGGVDLTFPHHENEIAQSEACCNHQVVKYWLHNGYINIDGEKMSKSLGNFFTIKEVLEKYRPEVIRFFLISKHYRSPINFSDHELDNAQKSLAKLKNTLDGLNSKLEQDSEEGNLTGEKLLEISRKKKDKFIEALDDDFNTALAIGVLHELAKEVNKFINSNKFVLTKEVKDVLKEVRGLFEIFGGEVLGIFIERKEETTNKELLEQLNYILESVKDELEVEDITLEGDSSSYREVIDLLLDLRKEAKKRKDYELADKIRERLDDLGIEVRDTPQGAEWKLINN